MGKQRVTDLEAFALRHVWRPYQSKMGYECTLQALPVSLEETAKLLATDDTGWASCVLDRIKAIGFAFPPYIKHPLVDVIVAAMATETVLAASPSPSMEMEVVQIDATDRDMIARGDRIGAKLVRQLLAHHDQAQSALAAMQMERDEARNLCDDTEAQVMDYAYRLEAAEAQVLRLTEENEALIEALARTAFDLESAKARIKALEEALRPFAAITEVPALGCVNKEMVIAARSSLKENAP